MTEQVEKMTLKDCLKIMVENLRDLNDKKEDVKIVCDSAWETLEKEDLTIQSAGITQKEMMKLAKQIANGKVSEFEDEHMKLGILLEKALGYKSDSEEEE